MSPSAGLFPSWSAPRERKKGKTGTKTAFDSWSKFLSASQHLHHQQQDTPHAPRDWRRAGEIDKEKKKRPAWPPKSCRTTSRTPECPCVSPRVPLCHLEPVAALLGRPKVAGENQQAPKTMGLVQLSLRVPSGRRSTPRAPRTAF